MNTVCLTGAEEHRALVDLLGSRLRDRGVGLVQGVGNHDEDVLVVLLWSRELAASAAGKDAQASAIAAWAEDRLLPFTLDDAPLPAGLADLDAQPLAWADAMSVENAIDRIAAVATTDGPAPEMPAQAPGPPPRAARRAGRGLLILLPALLIAVILGGLLGSTFVTEQPPVFSSEGPGRNGGCLPGEDCRSLDLTGGTDWLGMVLPVGGAVLTMSLIAMGGAWLFGRGAAHVPASGPALATLVAPAAGRTAASDIFVSYSTKDARTVDRLVGLIEEAGYSVWIDRSSRTEQPYRYAAPIVRAIKASRIVAVMSSQSSFRSDHVLREVYVAGDHGKPFLVFELEEADQPDEFQYFLSGFPRIPARTAKPSVLRSSIERIVK